MGWPTLSIEIAFATDPLAVPTWVDVTPYARRFNTKRGRQHEFGRVEAGSLNLTLDNRDRRFDSLHTTGPYYPNVVPMRRIRVRATWNAVTYSLFEGFATAWPTRYDGPNDAWVDVEASDIYAVLNLLPLVLYSAEVLEDAPVAYYKLDEATGTTAADSAGIGPYNGTYTGGPTPSSLTPFPGGKGSQSFDGADDYVTVAHNAAFNITGDLTLEFWIRFTVAPGNPRRYIIDRWDAASGQTGPYGLAVKDDKSLVYYAGPGEEAPPAGLAGPTLAGSTAWQHVAMTRSNNGKTIRWYVDGVLAQEATTNMVPVSATRATDIAKSGGGGFYEGRLAHVAIYNKALSAVRISAHYAAKLDVMKAQLTGAHINAILDGIGWPAGDRSVDAGNSTVQESSPDGSALEWLQTVADSESGLLFGTVDGKVGFHDRHSIAKPPHNTSQATFGDGGGSELPYLDVEPSNDDSDLWNRVRVERVGGASQVAEDSASKDRYGSRTLERTGLLISSDNEAYDLVTYLLYRYKDPVVRFPVISVEGRRTDLLWPQILGRDIHHDRVTVKRRPPGGGAAISIEQHIEGVEHVVEVGKNWRTTWSLVPADPQTYWLLGDSTSGLLGTTTRLGF